MRPPIEVELWKPVDNTRHVLAVTVSFEAAEKAYQEAVANLRLGEVVRLRDAVGTLLLSTNIAKPTLLSKTEWSASVGALFL